MHQTLLTLFVFWWLVALLTGRSGRLALVLSAPAATFIFWVTWLVAQKWTLGLDRALYVLATFAPTALIGLIAGIYTQRALAGLVAGVYARRTLLAAGHAQHQQVLLHDTAPPKPQAQVQAAPRPTLAVSNARRTPNRQAARQDYFRPVVVAIGGSLAIAYDSSSDPIPEHLKALLQRIDEAPERRRA